MFIEISQFYFSYVVAELAPKQNKNCVPKYARVLLPTFAAEFKKLKVFLKILLSLISDQKT
jgi:hypothetical protein